MARITLILSMITAVIALLGGFRWLLSEWRQWRSRRRITVLMLLSILLAPSMATAANHYVRDGATGTGADWTDACDDFAGSCAVASLVRGDTYYVADGTYAARTFDKAVSGSLVITIKKATIADHGTETGWVSTYGDGQASWTTWTMVTSYWLFDGASRNESNWFDTTAYGFVVGTGGTQDNQISWTADTQTNNITIKYVHVDGRSTVTTLAVRAYAIDTDPFNGAIFHANLLISRVYVSDSNNPYFIRGTDGTIIEYSANDNAWGNDNNHGEVVNLYFTAENAIIRYNRFKNAYVAEGGTACIAIQDTNGHQIYGNIFEDCGGGDGALGFTTTGNASNMQIYNNTFVKRSGPQGIEAPSGSGNVVRNNLWVGNTSHSINVGSGSTITHNATSAASIGGTSTQINVPTSIFVDYAGGNYHLASATTDGTTLSAPFTTDMDGITRGADGTWDRGAFEYTAPGTTGILLRAAQMCEVLMPLAGIAWHFRRGIAAVTRVSLSAAYRLQVVMRLTVVVLTEPLALKYLAARRR